MLNNDCLGIIGEYLTIYDLFSFCVTCKTLQQLDSLQYLWKKHCYEKWNCNSSLFMIKIRNFDGMALYPFASPISNHIEIPPDNVMLIRDLCVEYHGPIGESNRSVRSNYPFPDCAKKQGWLKSISSYLCGCGKSLSSTSRFFSTPFYDQLLQSYQIELRQVAYYEITIKSSTETKLSDIACVAIGLSTESFDLVKMMPGWNVHSYGYHSDDGAIFHGRGTQYATYGPKFGINDVVGCGLRYDTNEIFFTLNGMYLGVAFENVSGRLYPTVGIDAKVNISFNFGMLPFAFPLHTLTKHV